MEARGAPVPLLYVALPEPFSRLVRRMDDGQILTDYRCGQGGDGSRQPTDKELELARIQGKAFYEAVSKVDFSA